MRIAVLSDVHGNLKALEVVHAHVRQQAPDVIVNLGDCVSAPLWPEETAQYLMAENWPTVRGNHDRELSEKPEAALNAVDAFVCGRLSAASRDWLAALPATLKLPPDVMLCHGSPASDDVFLLEEDGSNHFFPSSEAQVRAKLGRIDAALLLCGHTHTPRFVRLPDGPTIVNPGSVGVQCFPGLTLTGSPHARYAMATLAGGSWHYTLHAVEYDWAEAASQAESVGFANWSYGLRTGYAAGTPKA